MAAATAFLFPTISNAAEITAGGEATTTPLLRINDLGTTKPYSSLEFFNNPGNFQFAIVTDRTGGPRPGIFEDAVRKLNLLQPEFVMSVGDLIQGYSQNPDMLHREWDEFIGFISELKMPFFYVPGNHDVVNDIEKKIWRERIGPHYYHFVYGDVLFLCLNSEDPTSTLSGKQVEYFRKALAENQNVRWTLVFLHRPLWVSGEAAPEKPGDSHGSKGGWPEFEKLLHGRRHTVYCGHVHSYTKYVRNNENYITLGTTGGGSPLRGARNYGEFDHVAWITMTDEGPIMANLELSGIWDENVRTEEVAELVNPLIRTGVQTLPLVSDPLPLSSSLGQIRLQNPADIPLKLKLQVQPPAALKVNPVNVERVLPPNSTEFVQIEVTPAEGVAQPERYEPIKVHFDGEYKLENHPVINGSGERIIEIDQMQFVDPAAAPVNIDGDLSDWKELPIVVRNPAQVDGRRLNYRGPADASFRFAVSYDDKNVYVAADVEDNKFVKRNGHPGDAMAVHLDPRGFNEDGTTLTGKWTRPTKKDVRRSRRDLKEVLIRAHAAVVDPVAEQNSESTSGTRLVTRRTDKGWTAEAAFPIEMLKAEQGEDWESFRLNIVIHDRDGGDEDDNNSIWWRPSWFSTGDYPNAGTFVKK